MPDDILKMLAARLEADLRTRFPEIVVQMVKDDDGLWMCRVNDGSERWGEASIWFDENDDDLSPDGAEQLLADITFKALLTHPWAGSAPPPVVIAMMGPE